MHANTEGLQRSPLPILSLGARSLGEELVWTGQRSPGKSPRRGGEALDLVARRG